MATTTAIQLSHDDHPLQSEQLKTILKDYSLHYSTTSQRNGETLIKTQQNMPMTTVDAFHQNPPNWPTQYHRIPPHRPINRNLDPKERPNGANVGEFIFVNVMLNGVRLQSGLVRLWEFTGYHWYPGLTRYDIGGEW